jgi:hypothetical protein
VDEYGNIEHTRLALLRILAGLVAMAGLSSEGRAGDENRRSISRRLRNAVLRLLRPAESAARRLVVAMARGLEVTLAPPRAGKPQHSRKRRQFEPVMPPETAAPKQAARACLPLFDRDRRFFVRPRTSRTGVPRISFCVSRQPIPRKPAPDDVLGAARLISRFDALSATLADLPKQALRLARWQARQSKRRAAGDRSRSALRQPLRFGRPPGTLRRSRHEAQDILVFSHRLALGPGPDTS